jgi:hypothetical protein
MMTEIQTKLDQLDSRITRTICALESVKVGERSDFQLVFAMLDDMAELVGMLREEAGS